nr:copia protein [Tanacetum cinerariifolium]
MPSLFADTYNVVAILEKSDAAEGFEQIIDFLSGSYIHYALTVNPHVYISCIKQFLNTASVKRSGDVTRLQALVDKKKIMISEVVIRKILQLDDAEGVVCLPNEEIFAGLAQMGYEKPSTKLTFYKAFFSSQWKFLIHTILQSLSAKRTSWNEFSTAMASAVICLSKGQKFNFPKVGKGFSGVETPLFEGMLARQPVEEELVDEQVQVDDAVVEENVAEDVAHDAIPSPPSHNIPSPSQEPSSPPQQPQSSPQAPSQGAKFPTQIQQVLNARVKRLEKANMVKTSKLRRLRKVGASKQVESSDHMEDVYNQGRMIDDMDKDEEIELVKDDADIAESERRHAAAEQAEVVKVVTTAKLITDVVTAAALQVSAASATIPAAKLSIHVAALTVVAAYTRKRKGVIIRDLEEELSLKTHAETPKVKDKCKEINKDDAEFNKDIDWDAAMDHVNQKSSNNPQYIKRYQGMKKRPQTKSEARKNMMIYLKNTAGYKIDFFKGMSYADICPIFQARFNENMRFLFKSREEMEEEYEEIIKSINETPAQKAAKRRKLNEEAQEAKELKKQLEIVNDEDDDMFTEATPLGRKTMFEKTDRQNAIWRNQNSVYGQAMVKSWKLLTSCGVHIISLTTTNFILLVERRYPLSKFTLEQLVNVARLQVEEESEMSLELLSGCSKHMTGNRNLFSTYKAYNGGNVIFGSNLRGNIIGKDPSSVQSYGGNRYTLVIVDDYSRLLQNSKAYIVLNKHTKKVEESLNMTFHETPPPSKTSPLVDDDLDEEEAIKVVEKKKLENDIMDATLEIDEIVNIKESRNHPFENVIENLNQRTLRNKLDENGIVSQNKGRLVAQGYNQQEGIDYDKTYALVARLESIRILLAYACALDFKLFQMDVKIAFLNDFINEEVYMAQPLRFINFEKPDHVYKLKKALYGLKQAPKACKGCYKTTPPSPNVIKSLFQVPRQDQVTRTKNKKTVVVDQNEILTREIQTHMKSWVDIICENAIYLRGYKDHVSACLCHMLYCIKTSTPYNLAFFIPKRMEKTQNKPKELLPYGMLLTRLFKRVVSVSPELAINHYLSHDRVMHTLVPHYERKTRSDDGKKRTRDSNASSSSTTLNHPSSSRPLDDTIDVNDEKSFHSNSSSLSQNVSSSSNVVSRVRQNSTHESQYLNTYLSKTINLQRVVALRVILPNSS